MLRLTARHADVWHSNASTFEEAVVLSRELDAVCEKRGRDPRTLRRSVTARLGADDETVQKAKAAVDAGFSDILVMLPSRPQDGAAIDPRKHAEQAAALLPRLRALG